MDNIYITEEEAKIKGCPSTELCCTASECMYWMSKSGAGMMTQRPGACAILVQAMSTHKISETLHKIEMTL